MPRNNNKKRGKFGRRPRNQRRNIRNNRFNRVSSISIGPAIVPDRAIVHLKYTEDITRAPGASFDEYIFSGNGAFDPNVTGTGGQPAGYDQWCAFYGRYLVLGSTITIKAWDNSTTNNLLMSVFPTDTTGGVSTVIDSISQPYVRWQIMNYGGGYALLRLRNGISTSKVWGKDCRFDDLFAAATGAQPSNQWYWCINADSSPGSNISYTMIVEITYRILFFKRVGLDLSIMRTKKVLPVAANLINEESKEFDECDEVKISDEVKNVRWQLKDIKDKPGIKLL